MPNKIRKGQIIKVTNKVNQVTANFYVNVFYLLGFIPIRVLQECSLGAYYSGDFYFLFQLNNKNLEWQIIKETIND